MTTPNSPLLQPSSSSLATAIAAAFNLVGAQRAAGGIINPSGAGADEAKRWATLVGDVAKILHDKVAGTTGGT